MLEYCHSRGNAMKERPFDRYTHCFRCKRYIDEETVKLKKIIVGPDTYRQSNPEFLDQVKYEKLCTDCVGRK